MDNQSPRRYQTDAEYRDKVKEATYNEFIHLKREQINGANHHWFGQYPLKDPADFTTVAIIRELLDLACIGPTLQKLDPKQQEGIADYIGETIRQGMLPNYQPFGEPVERKEYLPPSDPNSSSMQSAKVAIDMVHDFASRDVVYDCWPIDDPIREAALCTISAIQLKGGRTVEKALTKLPLDQKRVLVDTIRSVIEISVDKINHAGDHVHQIGGYEQPAMESPNALPKMKVYEQINQIADSAYWISKDWATRSDAGLGQAERVYGAVHEVLSMLQNGSELYEIPAFQLVPIDPETESGCVTVVDRDGVRVPAEWNFGQPMDLTVRLNPSMGAWTSLADQKSLPGSLTNHYQHMYETMRERFRTSALDLFGDPSDD